MFIQIALKFFSTRPQSSGVLGAGMNLTGIRVSQSPDQSLLSRLTVAYAKAALVLISLAVFEGTITGDFAIR